MCALKPGEKMLDSHDEIEETEDGQKIKFHYEKKDIGNDQIQISVSSDVLDTAEDMAEAMADIPAKDVKAKDDTAKVLGETVFKGGVEDVEELQAEDPMLEQPIEDIELINNQIAGGDKAKVEKALDDLEKADEEFAGEEEKDAAVETVLAGRGEQMKNIDANGDGLLDEKEVSKEIQKDMVKVDEINMMQQMHDEKKGLAELITALDKNKDEELSLKELFGDPQLWKVNKDSNKSQQKIENKMLTSLFDIADENADGKLDVNELFVFHNVQTLSTTEPKEYFKIKALDHVTYMDTDKDGEVDWKEFQNFMLPHVKAAIQVESGKGSAVDPKQIATHMSKFKELFDEADLNSDGTLDKDEMAQNLKEREEWIKGEAASETMEVADDNKDGKVSLNEVIKNAGEYGAKTEDFFEDSELLHIGNEDTSKESKMAGYSLKEQNYETETDADGNKVKYSYKKFEHPDGHFQIHIGSKDVKGESQEDWDGSLNGAKNLRGGN
jgi:Ca2+-binding EF-hand superfamily protein